MPHRLTICAFNAPEGESRQTGLPEVVESRLRDRRAQWIHMGGMDMRQVRKDCATLNIYPRICYHIYKQKLAVSDALLPTRRTSTKWTAYGAQRLPIQTYL